MQYIDVCYSGYRLDHVADIWWGMTHGACPRRAFNAQEARDQKAVVEREKARGLDGAVIFVLNGRQRFRNGYLQRPIAIKSLTILAAMPPLDELQRFKQVHV